MCTLLWRSIPTFCARGSRSFIDSRLPLSPVPCALQHLFAQFPNLTGNCIAWPDTKGAMVLVKALQFLPPGLIGSTELHHNALRVLVVGAA